VPPQVSAPETDGAAAPTAPALPEPEPAAEAQPAQVSDETPDPAVDPAQDPAVSDDMAPTSGADTSPAPQPAPATVEAEMQAPQEGNVGGAVDVQSETPVQPQPHSEALAAPAQDSELSISTVPVQPAMPASDDAGPAFPTDAPAQEGGTTDVTPSAEAPEVDDAAPNLPSIDDTGEVEGQVETELKPSIGQPAGDLEETFPQLQSNRLPSVGAEAEIVEEEIAAAPAPVTGTRPLVQFAAPFSNPDGKPLMAIVLIDDGETGMDAGVLSEFPYPLTFALNTLEPNVQDKMAAYRARGFEVLAMVDLPAVANASDVEIAMPAHLGSLPEAVAVLEGGQDGLQGSKELSDQVAQILLESGHGLVMLPKGLNTAQKLAAREGVPSATVFRDFDSKGQNAAAVRRFLDQGAFRAGQDGSVIMLGRLRPETVSALILWGLADRANTVALAPVSALLTAQ
jgi:polysaccharide deacetylase 2 family uncharacterized protein YibQ